MNLIVAVDNKWGIGKDGGLLLSLPTDMAFFKERTMGKVVVMGRKTLESLPGGRGLPGRTNYVLTHNKNYEAECCVVVNSDEELWAELKEYDSEDIFIIGGAELYNRYYKLCDRLFVTKIDADLDADTFIRNFDRDSDFEIESESEVISENGYSFRFVTYKRKNI
ncbi:MAG: dihydrofolate reductase [Mogibacterium sp.]|nr:dihydrofolate reductase [Mogibacterium sp.]